MPNSTRRRFLAQAMLLLSATVHANPLRLRARLARTPPLQRFSYRQVRLDSSRLFDQLQHNRRLYMSISDDMLLKPFRVRARQPAPGADMGGWYDASDDFFIDASNFSTANWHGYIPGHSFGQYVSGLARCYAASPDPAIKAKLSRLVDRYAATIHPLFFARYPLPAYTYDKLVIGLVDVYRYVGIVEARKVLDRLTDVVLPFLPEKALTREERRARPYTQEAEIWDEPYILPEHLFQAWQAGMGERYRELAMRYLQDEALFDPLARNDSPLKGKHAYSHVNALNSAIEAYYATGQQKYLDAASNGFAFVVAQSYSTGGWGPNEELLAPDDNDGLLKSLAATHRSFETPCGVYGHFKIARSLMQITRSSWYGDSMERLLYNTILGARPTEADGRTFYYADYAHEARKVFRGEAWPCCSGTFIQLAADYAISAYLQEGPDLYVNLYIPSRVAWTRKGRTVAVDQHTGYPQATASTLRISGAMGDEFTVYLRIPAWAGPATRVLVNGRPVERIVEPGRFLPIRATWHDGDRIELVFDMGLRLEPINAAHPEVVSLLYGPLVLFAILPAQQQFGRASLLGATRKSAMAWEVETNGEPVTFKPFMAIGGEAYRLYSHLAAPAEPA